MFRVTEAKIAREKAIEALGEGGGGLRKLEARRETEMRKEENDRKEKRKRIKNWRRRVEDRCKATEKTKNKKDSNNFRAISSRQCSLIVYNIWIWCIPACLWNHDNIASILIWSNSVQILDNTQNSPSLNANLANGWNKNAIFLKSLNLLPISSIIINSRRAMLTSAFSNLLKMKSC